MMNLMPPSPLLQQQRAQSMNLLVASNHHPIIPEIPDLPQRITTATRSSSMTLLNPPTTTTRRRSMMEQQQQMQWKKPSSSNRRGSLVPVELRRGHSVGSHHPNHYQQQSEAATTAAAVSSSSTARGKIKSTTSSTTTTSTIDDGWTPLGLEFFVAPLEPTRPEDESSVFAMNEACRIYESCGNNVHDLQTIQQLLEDDVITDTPFVVGARDSNLGVISFRQGQTQKALNQFQSAVQTFNVMIPIHDCHAGESIYLRVASLLNLSRALIRHNQIEEAYNVCVNQIQTLVEEFSTSTTATTTTTTTSSSSSSSSSRGGRYHHHHGSTTNIPLATRNQILWLGNVARYYIMGMVHQRRGELEEALTLYTNFTTKARHDLGHSHIHVATLLYMKGSVFFEQRKLQQALLAQLAALRIHEKQQNMMTTTTGNATTTTQQQQQQPREVCRILYSIGRTLHDKEEYRDALHMYQRTLRAQKLCFGPHHIVTITTMCNIARVHHIMGDIEAAMVENEAICVLAQALASSRPHPFWANRLVVLGNIYVEVGLMEKAMMVFDQAVSIAGGGDAGFVLRSNNLDVDNRLATSLHKAGLQHPCAATA